FSGTRPFVLNVNRQRIVGIESESIAITEHMAVDGISRQQSPGIVYGDRPEGVDWRNMFLIKMNLILVRALERFSRLVFCGLIDDDFLGKRIPECVPCGNSPAQVIRFKTTRMWWQRPVVDLHRRNLCSACNSLLRFRNCGVHCLHSTGGQRFEGKLFSWNESD